MSDFLIPAKLPVKLYCNNQAAIAIAKNHVFHERTKHVEIDCHIVQSHVEIGFIENPYIASKEQLANLFTKPISSVQMGPTMNKIGFIQFLHKSTKVPLEGGCYKIQEPHHRTLSIAAQAPTRTLTVHSQTLACTPPTEDHTLQTDELIDEL